MLKVEVGRKISADTERLSRTQELGQHLGGTGVIKKILASLDIAKCKTVVIDLFAHDGWIPLACLQLHIENNAIACGSVAHTEIEYKFTKESELLLHDFFGRAKTKQLNIAGFPDFTAALSDLSKVHTESARSDYEYLVTLPVGGDLIVLEALMSKFQNSVFSGEFGAILKKHDEEFNKQHKKASLAEARSELENVRRKREANTPRKLDKAYDDMTAFRDEHKLLETACGDVTLYYDTEENTLWVGSDRICGIPPKAEWFGFGAGDFLDGPTAKDIVSDSNGRWYVYSLSGPLADTIVIFESDRKLSEELKALPVWNQAVSLKEFLVAMEDKGEIVSFMGHTKENDQLKVNEKIIFVMDEMKSSPAKKRRISKVRPLVFGSYMDAAKLRSVRSPFKLTWRVRLNNNRQITPVRPVLIHTTESRSFNSPPFTVDAYEQDLQALSAAAKKGEEKPKGESSGLRKLERFEVKDSDDEDVGSPEEMFPEEDEEEEEEEDGSPKKRPAKKNARGKPGSKKSKKKKQSESDEADKKRNKKDHDDDEDSDEDEDAERRFGYGSAGVVSCESEESEPEAADAGFDVAGGRAAAMAGLDGHQQLPERSVMTVDAEIRKEDRFPKIEASPVLVICCSRLVLQEKNGSGHGAGEPEELLHAAQEHADKLQEINGSLGNGATAAAPMELPETLQECYACCTCNDNMKSLSDADESL
ncbi:unnamed protein product [Symbiodinium sp. CCMP2592]|nr:unnamed protein product [Symbiodinium sp. CCMP2592]